MDQLLVSIRIFDELLVYYNGMANMLQEEVLIIILDHILSHFLLEWPVLHLIFQ